MARAPRITALLLVVTLLCAVAIPSFCSVAYPRRLETGGHQNNPAVPRSHGVPSESAKNKYDPVLSQVALKYSKMAYCDADALKGKPKFNCTDLSSFEIVHVNTHDIMGTLGYTALDHAAKRIIVAFRGTLNYQNIIEDIAFIPWTYRNRGCTSGCSIHAGFDAAYNSIRDAIVTDVVKMRIKYPDYSLLLTGHSLGGAMASLCAVDLATLSDCDISKITDVSFPNSGAAPSQNCDPSAYKLVPSHLYTFGQPRVGDDKFSVWANGVLSNVSAHRIVHNKDPVPHLPFMSFGYFHFLNEVWYDSSDPNVYTVCKDNLILEDPSCSDSSYALIPMDHHYYLGTAMDCVCIESARLGNNPYIISDNASLLNLDRLIKPRKQRFGRND